MIHISSITFQKFGLSAGNRKSRGSFRVQLLLPIGQWNSKFIIDKNTNYSKRSTERSFSDLDLTQAGYGHKTVYH